jgi:membrane protein YdbS with pleckstrin-like domain
MQLSQSDQRFVERLRKRQEQMIRWRWVRLMIGLACLAGAIAAFVSCFRAIDPIMLAMAMAIPTIYVMAAVGIFVIAYTLSHWRGKAESLLLLRLLEDYAKNDH